MTVIDNPSLNLPKLKDISNNFQINGATVNDYELLDFYFGSLGAGKSYILNILRNYGISSYKEYIQQRDSQSVNREAYNTINSRKRGPDIFHAVDC